MRRIHTPEYRKIAPIVSNHKIFGDALQDGHSCVSGSSQLTPTIILGTLLFRLIYSWLKSGRVAKCGGPPGGTGGELVTSSPRYVTRPEPGVLALDSISTAL